MVELVAALQRLVVVILGLLLACKLVLCANTMYKAWGPVQQAHVQACALHASPQCTHAELIQRYGIDQQEACVRAMMDCNSKVPVLVLRHMLKEELPLLWGRRELGMLFMFAVVVAITCAAGGLTLWCLLGLCGTIHQRLYGLPYRAPASRALSSASSLPLLLDHQPSHPHPHPTSEPASPPLSAVCVHASPGNGEELLSRCVGTRKHKHD